MKVLPTHSGGQLSLILRIIVWFLKIIGLAPFSLHHINNSTRNSWNSRCTSVFLLSKIGLTYNIMLSLLVAIVGAFSLPELSTMNYPNKSLINQAVDVTQAIIRTSTVCIIIVFGAFKQKKTISIMTRLLKVDILLSSMKNYPPRKKTLLILVTVQMIVNAIIWVIFWVTEGVFVHCFLHWFIFNVPIFIIHWYVIGYAIMLGIVAMEFESLNNNLLSFQEFPNNLFRAPVLTSYTLPILSSTTYCSQLVTLELFHNIRTTLSELSQDIANFYSFSTLPAVACFSLTLVSNLWYLIIPIIIPKSDLSISTHINSATWILVSMYPLILLSLNVVETLKEAQLTGLVIHKLLAMKIKRQEIQTELEQFSLQLMHEKFSFTAFGFFALDFTLIQSIFAFTATYLVIIVQFMQSTAYTPMNT